MALWDPARCSFEDWEWKLGVDVEAKLQWGFLTRVFCAGRDPERGYEEKGGDEPCHVSCQANLRHCGSSIVGRAIN